MRWLQGCLRESQVRTIAKNVVGECLKRWERTTPGLMRRRRDPTRSWTRLPGRGGAQEREREKKKVKTEDQPEDKDKPPDTPGNVAMKAETPSSEIKNEASSSGVRRRHLGEDEVPIDLRARVPESRGEKRTDEQNEGRPVRFKVPDKQGEKRVVEEAASGDAKIKKIRAPDKQGEKRFVSERRCENQGNQMWNPRIS